MRVGQAFLKMDVAVLRLRQGSLRTATGARRAEDGRTPVGGRFRGVSILVEANSYVCGESPSAIGGRFLDRINRIAGAGEAG